MSVAISAVHAREILDSRGNPTIEIEVDLEDGTLGRVAVPSGTSFDTHEPCELRDTNDKKRYLGKGLRQAVENADETLAAAIIDLNVTDQAAIDKALIEADGTPNKSRLGANSILACSLACAHAAARVSFLPMFRYLDGVGANTLTVPVMNIINEGARANNAIDLQEFSIVPCEPNSDPESNSAAALSNDAFNLTHIATAGFAVTDLKLDWLIAHYDYSKRRRRFLHRHSSCCECRIASPIACTVLRLDSLFAFTCPRESRQRRALSVRRVVITANTV